MDAEGGLIATVLDSEDNLMMALQRGVTVEFFDDDQHRKVWDYIAKFFSRYSKAPKADVIAGAYPSYKMDPPEYPAEFYVDSLADRRRKALIYQGMQDAAAQFDEEGPDVTTAMRTTLMGALEQASIETRDARWVDITESMKLQVAQWRKGGPGLGISYGFPTLDHHTSGMRPEQFVVLTGLPKSKKSWTLLFMASNAHITGIPVAFISFEMSSLEHLERLATLWGKIPQHVMQQKQQITSIHARDLRRMLNIREQMPGFIGVEDAMGTSTVSSVAAMVKETGVAVVFIDGLYLMTDERSGMAGFEGTQPLTSISRDLKRMAKAQKVTVVATTQTLPSKTKQGKTNLFGMGYTSAFSQDADLIVGVEAPEGQSNITVMRILGNRNGMQNIEFQVSWDLDNGLVEEFGQSFATSTTGASYGLTNAGSAPVPGGAGTPTGPGDQGWGGDHGPLSSASLTPGT
jgi:KaiC/GvpD/RAD55 family RecA-like ATPase